MPARVVVLISGSGSNLQALIDHGGTTADYVVVGVISNRPNVKGLTRATDAGIPAITLDHTRFATREHFDAALLDSVQSLKPDIIALAGFMRILTPVFVKPLQGKMLNIHPSLLPLYAGLHTHQRALDAGDALTGCTVHFVTEALDGGPAVLQATVNIDPNDTSDSLASKVLVKEHKIFPLAVKYLAQERLQLIDSKAIFDQKPLSPSGLDFN